MYAFLFVTKPIAAILIKHSMRKMTEKTMSIFSSVLFQTDSY